MFVSGKISPRILGAFASAFLAVPALMISAAATDQARSIVRLQMSPNSALGLARKHFEENRLDQAQAILIDIKNANPEGLDKDEFALLSAQILARRGEEKQAAGILRSLLSHTPDFLAARLELAKILYDTNEDRSSAYHFRKALGANLSPNIEGIVKSYLRKIQARKALRISFSGGLIPNTNVNTATADDAFTTPDGAEFTLSGNAQQKSGLGFRSDLGLTRWFRLSDRWRFETGTRAQVTDYSSDPFDDVTYSLSAGPEYRGNRFQLKLIGRGSERSFGGDRLSTGLGARLVLSSSLAARTRFSINMGYTEYKYFTQRVSGIDQRDGPVVSAGVSIVRALTPSSSAGGSFQISNQRAVSDVFRNMQYYLAGTYQRELPLGLNARLQPGLLFRDYAGASPVFSDEPREDIAFGLSVDVTSKDMSWQGFAPIVGYSYWHNDSNIDFYSYDQHKVNLSLTRVY